MWELWLVLAVVFGAAAVPAGNGVPRARPHPSG